MKYRFGPALWGLGVLTATAGIGMMGNGLADTAFALWIAAGVMGAAIAVAKLGGWIPLKLALLVGGIGGGALLAWSLFVPHRETCAQCGDPVAGRGWPVSRCAKCWTPL